MKSVTIYTDGACSGNPGPGGWGVLLIHKEVRKTLCGGEASTTNNRMELTAVIEALKALKNPCEVALYTDSKYVIQGIEEWIINWKKNQWRNSRKEPVKNADLWQILDDETTRHHITWHWVKGHAGNPGNEAADLLANQGMAEYVGV